MPAASKGTAPDVSIVIPVYNEEAILHTAVAGLVDRLAAFPWTYEIVLAENGSKDRTVEVARELCAHFPGVTTFSASEPNYGKALKACEAALDKRPGDQGATLTCAFAACKLKSSAKAKKYMRALSSETRQVMVRQTCIKAGVTDI